MNISLPAITTGASRARRAVLAVSLLTLGLSAYAAPTVDYLRVGASIPASTVFTADNEAVNLRETVAAKPTVLVFYRGGWCPYCIRHLAALAEVETQIAAAGFQVLAISADQPSKLAATPDHEKLGYTLLSDSSMETAKAFGITFVMPDSMVEKYKRDYHIDLEASSGQTHHLLPHPAVFIVDTAGVIRFAHVNPDYKVRLTPEEILTAVRDVSKPATP